MFFQDCYLPEDVNVVESYDNDVNSIDMKYLTVSNISCVSVM